MSAPARVLVTGASGFVGSHLCAFLAGEGTEVRGLVRSPAAALPPGTTAIRGELGDREALDRALDGVDAVVHLAARVHVMEETAADPLAEFRRTNVEGTRLLLERARAAGVRRFVFLSSVKAMGEANGAPWTEDDPPAPADPYGASKLEAEAVVREAAGSGLQATALRVPLVYGPGMKGNMLRLFDAVDRGHPLPFGRVRNRRSLLYVGNLVQAVRAVLSLPGPGYRLFLASDGEDVSTPELVRAIAVALGRPARLLPVPSALFRAAGRVGDALGRIAPFPVGSAVVDRLLGSLTVDPGKLFREAGFTPPFTLAEGLAHSAGWYRRRTAGGAR